MSTRFKNFIFNGFVYGISFFILSFIVAYYPVHLPLRKSIFISVLIGIVMLIINGLIQTRFTKSSKSLRSITIPLQELETIKVEAPANHIVDDHLISGKLFLTEKRLVFRSFQQKEYSWLLLHLHHFKFHKSIFNAGGEFIVKADNQNTLVFEVDEIRLWKRSLLNIQREQQTT